MICLFIPISPYLLAMTAGPGGAGGGLPQSDGRQDGVRLPRGLPRLGGRTAHPPQAVAAAVSPACSPGSRTRTPGPPHRLGPGGAGRGRAGVALQTGVLAGERGAGLAGGPAVPGDHSQPGWPVLLPPAVP